MTDLQRLQRAAFIREQPFLWFAQLYAAAFLGCAVVHDMLLVSGAGGLSPSSRYLLPLVGALPAWVGLRGWSRRVMGGAADRPLT